MTEHTPSLSPSLATVYQGWDQFQRDLLKAVAPLSTEQLTLPVAPTHWPIGMLVQHILNDRLWWFHLWMDAATPEETAYMHWEEEENGKSVHSTAELVAGLEATWAMIHRSLAHWTVADLGYVFDPPATLTERERQIFGPSTRQEILFHVLRHDIHHGGELAVGMGSYHLPTIWG
ncbi:MAG TPA: DinB family protein [Ktedonobacterales bacterium]|nr:DinB family protein [Ktedonobacterales bacterium]